MKIGIHQVKTIIKSTLALCLMTAFLLGEFSHHIDLADFSIQSNPIETNLLDSENFEDEIFSEECTTCLPSEFTTLHHISIDQKTVGEKPSSIWEPPELA